MSTNDSDVEPTFEALLNHLKSTYGFDFTGYKRSSLRRRVLKRMQAVRVEEDFERYRDYLEAHTDEVTALFNTILINVTSFFRDPDTWKVLETEAIPRLLQNKSAAGPIRVWSAACA